MSSREGKAGRRSDSVWSHFSKSWTDEKHYVVICIHCKQRVSAKVDRLRRHLRKCICSHGFKSDFEGTEGSPVPSTSCSDAQTFATDSPSQSTNVDPSSSHLSPMWKMENVLIDSKDSPHSPSAMANQQYCLKWNNHQSNLLRAFDRLLQSESFTDVTLACEGKSLRAHKVVLSACSSYFEQLFEEHPDKSPIIILKDMKFTHVSQLVNFMYRGEINITQDMLSGLLKTAETLKVKGLAEVSGDQPAQVANPMPPILRLAASSHGPRFVTQEMLQHSRQASLPQMVPPNSSPLTTALNAPMVAPPTLAPLAALLNPESMGLDERRVNLLKRMSQDHEPSSGGGGGGGGAAAAAAAAATGGGSGGGGGGGSVAGTTQSTASHESTPKMPRRETEEESGSQQVPHASLFMSPQEQPAKQPVANVLTPIPHELTVNAQQELPDFLKNYTIFRLNDYLGFRTRQQFWEEPAVRRILEGIKNKEIDMKSAAELLGVSYGTLYGRYREVFGYLKHSWVNKPGRTPGSGQKERSIWEESRAQELIQRVLNKELSLTAAAVRLGVDTNTFFAHLTDNGKNKSRVALLLGTDNSSSENTFGNVNHSEDSNSANAAVDAVGDDSNPPENSGGLVSEDSNMESIAENSHNGSEVNGEKDDSEEPEIIDDSNTTVRSSEHITALEEITVEGNEGDDQGISDQGSTDQPMESFQSMVEEESGNMYTETT
ncbi:uncharacterized protein LOC134768811 isoform X1 [Penaeus indicus]|uniref:uncharacterized protein LOC134768811 isoform X1 n=1 Tax=Penaeus indicus TaxID=29960 RepID=UPI00300D88B3